MGSQEDKEEVERFLVTEYLKYKAASPRNVRNLREFMPNHRQLGIDGPDVCAMCDWNGRETTVGVELTEYQVDRVMGESPSRQAAGIWKYMLRRFWEKHFVDHPELASLEVSVSLTRSTLPPKKALDDPTSEIAAFLIERTSDISHHKSFHRFGSLPHQGDFEMYPILKEFVNRISIWRTNRCIPNRLWQLGDAAHVGVSNDVLAETIKSKTVKFHRYDFTGMDESWLLICASGATASSGAAPEKWMEADRLASPELCELARNAPFDRIIFWERPSDWDFDYAEECL